MNLDDIPLALGVPALYSYLSIPGLAVMWLTALFGLNDVRAQRVGVVLTRAGMIEFMLGLFFFALLMSTSMMIVACLSGLPMHTWRFTLLVTSVAGVFAFVGVFAPWRRWLQSLSIRAAMEAAA